MPTRAPIGAGDGFLVARRVPLGVLLDLVATFLDALEAEFDLFVEPPERKNAGETAISRPPTSLCSKPSLHRSTSACALIPSDVICSAERSGRSGRRS